jgi:hypothetical protein
MGNLNKEKAAIKDKQPKIFCSRKIGKMRQQPINSSYINKFMSINPGSRWYSGRKLPRLWRLWYKPSLQRRGSDRLRNGKPP